VCDDEPKTAGGKVARGSIEKQSIGSDLMKRSGRKWLLVGVAIVVAALTIAARLVEIDTYLTVAQEWVWSFGMWGPVVYAFAYLIGMLLFLPGTPFTILAALLFGALWGFATMTVGTTAAAAAGFLIGRFAARGAIERRFGDNDQFRRLRELTERNDWIAIPFIHLMPVFPFAATNYAAGLTRLSLSKYLLLSQIVFVPMNAIYVLGAGALYRAAIRGEVSWSMIGLSVGAAVFVLAVGIVAKKSLGGLNGDSRENAG
jgi:uncharacterized membrane protein YdjX (TVP38/TMEM64 family)